METLFPVKEFQELWELFKGILIQISLIFRNLKEIKKELWEEGQMEMESNSGHQSEG